MSVLVVSLLIGILCMLAMRIAIVRLFVFFVLASLLFHYFKGG